jgi:hypothetical protein
MYPILSVDTLYPPNQIVLGKAHYDQQGALVVFCLLVKTRPPLLVRMIDDHLFGLVTVGLR